MLGKRARVQVLLARVDEGMHFVRLYTPNLELPDKASVKPLAPLAELEDEGHDHRLVDSRLPRGGVHRSR